MAGSPLQGLRVGYVPIDATLQPPGDRRRFVRYAKERGIAFEVADPRQAYDVVIATQRADLSVWSRYPHGKVVFDFIDSYLSVPPRPRHLLRGLAKFAVGQSRRLQLNHWSALRAMCRRADAVVCSTSEQAQAIEPQCRNIHLILDLHDEEVGRTKADYDAGSPFQLVWEGLPQNVRTLGQVGRLLAETNLRTPLTLNIVTDRQHTRWLGRVGKVDTEALARRIVPGVDIKLHPWTPSALESAACSADLALIPLPLDDPLYRGKPENKLLLFWRMGVPVLASATPAYSRAMAEAGVDGACADEDDWRDGLEAMLHDAAARRLAGQRGRSFAQARHSPAATFARWDAMFASLAK
ncbi:MAG: glycosyltransferase family protein [Thermoplasmatota archaeon]